MPPGRLLRPLLLSLALCGCGRKEDAPAPAAAAPAPLPPVAIGNVEATVPDDPSRDGWDTELASERISAQLGVLKKWLTADAAKPEDLAAVLAAEVSGRAMPDHDAEVHDDGFFTVWRAKADAAGRELSGTAAVAEALRALRQGNFPQCLIKVTRIQQSAAGWETGLVFELAETTARGRRQVNAQWSAVWSAENPPRLKSLTMQGGEELLAASAEAFVDCTEAVVGANASWTQQLALGTDHWTARIESILGMDVNGQNGVTLGDINGDGLDDLYLTQQGGLPNRMFVREAGGTLRDVTEESGTGWLDDGHAALLVDLDNDGDQDLVTGMRDGVLIQANDGSGHFTVKAAKLTPTGPPYGLAAADYDQDGDLDIFAACYYQRATAAKNYTFARPVPYYDAENGAQDVLLRNDGNWVFTDSAKASGIVDSKFSYAPSWEDCDNDGDQDLYVANDFGSNRLWRNDRTPEGTVIFTEVAAAAGVQDTAAGMSSAWGDADNDGLMDLYVANMFSSAGNRIASQEKFQSGASTAERGLFQRHARGNSLFRNKGQGTFDDISESAGVTLGRWAWSSLFGDLNNDGKEDLYVANGYITQVDLHDL